MDIIDPPDELNQPDAGIKIVQYGPPPGYSSGEIGIAKFLVDRQEPRYPTIHTYWRPTPEELAALADGAAVQFSMVTQVPPPVSAAVYPPTPAVAGLRCIYCGHPVVEHGPSGCAADDEAAVAGCDCEIPR